MSSLLAEIKGAIDERRADGDEVVALVMALMTAMDLSTEMYNAGIGVATPHLGIPSLYGVPVIIEGTMPFGEWVIASKPGWVDFPAVISSIIFSHDAVTSDSYGEYEKFVMNDWKDV